MKQIFTICNIDIIVYKESEKNLFIDDNKAETVIFIDDKGNKILKRFIIKDEGKITERILKTSFNNIINLPSKENISSLEK